MNSIMSMPDVDDSVSTRDSIRILAELRRLQGGDHSALDALLPLLFQPLRRIAHAQRTRVDGSETLCTTALIHEAYLKLRHSGELAVEDDAHFLNLAARAMRQILIDHARARTTARQRDLASGQQISDHALQRQATELLELDAALQRLEPMHPRLMQIVLYRFFAGYSEAETGRLLAISTRTVRRDWLKAKALLLEELGDHDDAASRLA